MDGEQFGSGQTTAVGESAEPQRAAGFAERPEDLALDPVQPLLVDPEAQ